MTKLATFSAQGRVLFYVRLAMMVGVFVYTIHTAFSDYGRSGTYRWLLPALIVGSAIYAVRYAKVLLERVQRGDAMIWLDGDKLYWFGETLGTAPLHDMLGASAHERILTVSLRSGPITFKDRFLSEPPALVASRLSALCMAR
jgi:hypothetical protein